MIRIFILFLFLVPLLNSTLVAKAYDSHVSRIEKTPVPDFKPPEIKIHTLANGLKIYFLPNPELPILEVSALLSVGNADDSGEHVGLASLMLHGLRTGGTTYSGADEIDKTLDQIASDIDVEVSREFSTVELRSLVSHADTSLKLFFDLLQFPLFDADKIEILRNEMLDSIRRRNEDPMGVAKRKFGQELYGHESPWARVPTLQSIQSIQQEDLIAFHQKMISPDRILLAVSGNIKFSDLLTKLEKLTKDWTPHPVVPRALPPVEKKWNPSVQILDMPVNQSALIVGHFADKRFNPDKYALIIVNQIMGQSTIGSRLGARIRTDLGLAYSVFSYFGLDTDYGPFEVLVGTKSASTLLAIEETRNLLKEMQTVKPITAEEMETAKQTILNQMVFQYEEPFKIVISRVMYDYFGYPQDYLSIYQREIKQVTLPQIQHVMQNYYFPDQLKIVVVGDKKAMGDLSSLGKIEFIEMGED